MTDDDGGGTEDRDALACGDADHIEAISNHIEQHVVGPVHMVFHELGSPGVHVDVHHVAPSAGLPYNVLVTSGMSDKPMTVPDGAEEFRFAELFLVLPADWPLTESRSRTRSATGRCGC
jgi:hypothetical protein